MKKISTLLLLLVLVCFYGNAQNEDRYTILLSGGILCRTQ